MAPAPLPANATKSEALAWLKANYGKLKYANTVKTPYEGMGYAQIYAYLEKQYPGKTPYEYAGGVVDLLLSSAFGKTVGGAVGAAGGAIGDVATGIQTTSYLGSLGNLLAAFTSANLWIRVAKVAIGGTILIVGLVKLTGADKSAGGIAAKAVKAAPFL